MSKQTIEKTIEKIRELNETDGVLLQFIEPFRTMFPNMTWTEQNAGILIMMQRSLIVMKSMQDRIDTLQG